MENIKENPRGIYIASWSEVLGVKVLRIPGSEFFGVPLNPLRRIGLFDMMQIHKNHEVEFLCQLSGEQASRWLCSKARSEGLPSNTTLEEAVRR